MKWTTPPKTIRRKKHVLGQMMVQVNKTGLSVMQFHQGQHKMCEEKNKHHV